MIALLDNDVVLKLARYDLFDHLIRIIGEIADIRILSTLRYKFRLRHPEKALAFCTTKEAYDRLCTFVDSVQAMEKPENDEIIARLGDVPSIDPGEALLFAYNLWKPESLTYIGDKRAITALGKGADISDVTALIQGRVKCFEQIMAEFLIQSGVEVIQAKVQSAPGCDTTMDICFRAQTIVDVLTGLISYYQHLSENCNGILMPFPSLPESLKENSIGRL